MFSLKKFETQTVYNQGQWLHLKDPATGELAYADEEQKKPCRIQFLTFKSTKGGVIKANMAKRIKNRRELLTDDTEFTEADQIETIEYDAKVLSELAVGWENILDADGVELEFDPAVFYQVAINAPELRAQCFDFIVAAEANFTNA
jgi:hypothetical protein